MNTIIQFILKLLGMGGGGKIESMIKDMLLSKGAGGGNPLESLMNQFKSNGLGNIFQSWVGTGKNEPVTPQQIAQGIGTDQMAALSAKSNIPQDVLAQKLAQYLPGVVDKMTPAGKIG